MPDENPEFNEWDYENGKAILWRRLGECNNCGACCKIAKTIQYDVTYDMDYETHEQSQYYGGRYTSEDGIWNEIQFDEQRRYFGNMRSLNKPHVEPCNQWKHECCAVHNEDKPVLCKQFPMSPRNIEAFPDCSYTFEKVKEWAIED